ncbi:MAG TPA: hypothetical protein VFV08_14640, partial [Puia sp.]|nr:hypothetical protein [Puia sp.]
MSTATTQIVLAYHHAFYKNQRTKVRQLLADKGSFNGPLNSFTDPDQFLDAAAIFMRLTIKTVIKKVFVDDTQACIIYSSVFSVPSIPVLPIASWFKVAAGKIYFFQVHFDPTAFLLARENGDIAKVLA